MAGHPARNRSVRCAVSQSGRATYEISRRSSPTAITSATSITAKFPSLHSNIMRWPHDNPRRFKISPANGSQPQARLQRRNCESSGCPLLLFRVGLLSKPQRLNPFDNMGTMMKKFTLLGAAAILFISLGASVMAQQVISEPGYCAQFYPNANCQNEGPNNPYTGDYRHRT